MVVWLILLIQKVFAESDDEAVKTMTRTGDRRELLKEALYFVIVAIICGTLFYETFPGIVAMTCLSWGDGFAPIIGSRYGKWKYKILSEKSIEGSLAMFIFAFVASIFFVLLIIPNALNINRIFIIAFMAMIVEGFSPKEIDNILIPITAIAITSFV